MHLDILFHVLIFVLSTTMQVLSNPQLWLVSLGNAVPSGMLTAWQNLMGLNFGPLGVSDADIGRIGFVSIFVQAIVASAVAFVQDKLPRYIFPS